MTYVSEEERQFKTILPYHWLSCRRGKGRRKVYHLRFNQPATVKKVLHNPATQGCVFGGQLPMLKL